MYTFIYLDAAALAAAVEAALRFNASGPRVKAALAQVYIYTYIYTYHCLSIYLDRYLQECGLHARPARVKP